MFERALDALAVKPAEAWMIGDNLEWDIAQAQRMGIHGIWVDGRGRGLPKTASVRPDRIVRAIAELAPR